MTKKQLSRCRTAALLLCVLLLFPLLCACGDVTGLPLSHHVRIMLAHDDGLTVKSENPQKVERNGTPAVFEIEIADGYKIISCDGAVYSDGVLTVSDTSRPLTVNVVTRPLLEFEFGYGEGIESTLDAGVLPEDTEITVTAPETRDGRVFIGYSDGKKLSDGGTLVSYIRDYTFNLTENLNLYANYAAAGAKIIMYDANGGSVKGGGDSIYIELTKSVFTCPNTLIGDGYFTREGYVLAGYNTEPDGSGRYYGCGWNIVLPEDGIESLYAVWYPVTDPGCFTLVKLGEGLMITAYSGTDETVVIPETVGGKKITYISANAFYGESFKTLFITKNINAVANSAVRNCDNFTTLYLADSVLTMSDSAVVNCPNLSTLYLQAVRPPTYMSSRNGNYQIKYERLMTAQSPKIIITGGSNVAYGIDSAQLESELGGTYSVVNYGCNQSTPAVFYMEIAAYWMNEGDILIHAGESFTDYQYGNNTINTTLWQIFEGAYGAFSCVDIRHFNKLFSSFASFNTTRSSRSAQDYERYSSETVNFYGDYIKTKKGQVYTPAFNSHTYSTSILKENYLLNINRAFDLCRGAGGRVYLSFGVINATTLKGTSKTASVQDAFGNSVAEALKPDAVISKVSTYVMDTSYFYNSDFHLGTAGSKIRTSNLAADILAQFAAEKSTN